MSFIRWQDLDPNKVERAIKSLILEMHDGARPIDGSGGDGGRDLRWDSPDGLVIFEIKSYVDRLGTPQRRNIKDSLRTASQHRPARWVLVLPLDHSPAEEKWFDQLGTEYPDTDLVWYGRTWLDVEFSKREYLRRMVEGDSYRLHELAREFDKEQAALVGGLPDAVDRISKIVVQAQDLSPYWIAEVTVGPNRLHVQYRERYPGAGLLDPVTPEPRYLFPSEDAEAADAHERLKDFHDYGGDIEIDGKYVVGFDLNVSPESRALFEMATQGETERLRLTSTPVQLEHPLLLQLAVVASSGMIKYRLNLQTEPPTVGNRGLRAHGTDPTGAIQIVATIDRPEFGSTHRAEFSIKGIAGKFPYVIRPAFDIFGHLTDDGDRLELRVNDQSMGEASGLTAFLAEARHSAQVLAALEHLQTYAQMSFPVPDDLTYEDAFDLLFAAKLLTGEPVRAANTRVGLTIRADKLEDFLASHAAQTPGALTAGLPDYALQLGPHRLTLGAVTAVAPKMALTNLHELRAAVGTGAEPTAWYECTDGEGIYYRLGPLILDGQGQDG